MVSSALASATATGIYVSFVIALNAVSTEVGIQAKIGSAMISVTWLSTALSIVGRIIWGISSHPSSRIMGRDLLS